MTRFKQIAASPASMANFLSSLPTLKGPWDEAFDKAFCSTCGVQDCNAEGCPHQQIRDNVILWWLRLSSEAADAEETAGDLVDILERATPKAPTKDSLADRGCPSCGEYISWDALNDPLEYAPQFCKHCGQALDWSQEKRHERGV